MPVPTAVETTPRKLLRDVVFEQLLAAIEDGTLEPGERLNDEELEKWLGVSRTPIREAISKLADIGLVETAPQRYTRVAKPTIAEFWDALRMLNGFHELSARWAIPNFTDDDVEAFRALGEELLEAVERSDAEGFRLTREMTAFLVERSGNAILQQMAGQLRARTSILSVTAGPKFQTDIYRGYVNGLVAAAEARDAGAAEQVMRQQAEATDAFMATVADEAGSAS